ncbi:threonine--tRNA ligase [Simkania negevensis]|uniref:Threonine--tRNA ligase n=1 Tax=Simkania negevensis TaxID=83561 RepID=A0ABS3AQT5_9BACT|nr:threonine--tRNA ligase [Simkania negevensis]
MSSDIHIRLADGSTSAISPSSTGKELAERLNLSAPDQALALKVNGITCDLSTQLEDGDDISFLNFSDKEGKEVFWHTSAHVLAQAVLRLWPNVKPTIGPPIQQGFYYDFANLVLSDADFERIENEVKKIVKENHETSRMIFDGKQQALDSFKDNSYKTELIKEFPESDLVTAYRQGEFFDLCRGPHIPRLGKIKAFKVMKTSGAYWRGNSSNEMLTRIYAISFPDKKMLKEYLYRLEEAKRRDHKVLGPALDLFSLREEAPGMPFIHPHGMTVWNSLVEYMNGLLRNTGYLEIKTPTILSRELWERSGHWENYKESMFTANFDERDFAIKPMNCPGCMLYFSSRIHSYRELPLRIAEIGHVHRNEPSGAISGLFRARSFHQDDAHIFLSRDQIKEEILHILNLTDEVYSTFGLKYTIELSTKPEENTIGSDEDWEAATEGLRQALDEFGTPYKVSEGEGAFYGPKIDFHIYDALDRTWQCGTIQLDMALPQRFGLEYVDAHGERARPVIIHRALYGSVERFFGILIEHFAGKFPLWMSPRPVCLVPIADRHNACAEEIQKKIRKAGLLCDIDSSHESVSKKIRKAQLSQYNYMLTIGDKEMENDTVSLRTRDNVVHGEVELYNFLEKTCKEQQSRALTSPYQQ